MFDAARQPVPHAEGRIALSSPHDRGEQDADHAAELVAGGLPAAPGAAPGSPSVPPAPGLAAVLAAQGGGRQLSQAEITEHGPRFGFDFSRVRVRADAATDRAARTIGATAYTFDNQISLRSQAYQPGTSTGRRLLAHELAHIVQQSRSPMQLIQRQTRPPQDTPATSADPGITAEQSADLSVTEEAELDDRAQQAAERGAFWNSVKQGAAGIAYGTTQSLTPGGFLAPSPAPRSRTFEFFRGAGQLATGLSEAVVGGAGDLAGGALDLTGIGAAVGIPLNVVATATAVHGAVGAAAGLHTIAHAMSMGSGSSGGARLPAAGTPERVALENARRRGVAAAQRRELDNIRAGGRGTPGNEVWSDAELAQIRANGKFPSDSRWHHSPTVANRPDLAGDGAVVRPIRGGVQGHLAAHGGDFRR